MTTAAYTDCVIGFREGKDEKTVKMLCIGMLGLILASLISVCEVKATPSEKWVNVPTSLSSHHSCEHGDSGYHVFVTGGIYQRQQWQCVECRLFLSDESHEDFNSDNSTQCNTDAFLNQSSTNESGYPSSSNFEGISLSSLRRGWYYG